MTRREFLLLLGATGIASALPGCSARSLHFQETDLIIRDDQKNLFVGLARSLKEEYDYMPRVEGKIPEALKGTLYRNGVGLYERNGMIKRALMDGDGMAHLFRFDDKGVRFMNRFVRTEKYIEESEAGRFIYPTFSTQAPGGFFQNIWAGSRIKSQAQITVVYRNSKLYAFDESAYPYELDPDTLETAGVSYLGLPEGTSLYNAHSKIDMHTGEWIHFGLHYGRKVTLHITIFQKNGKLASHREIELPRYIHMHDFFATKTHLVFTLHPVSFRLSQFLFGVRSMYDSLDWKSEMGNLVMVISRQNDTEPLYLQTAPCFMWHSLNAYESSGMIFADFVGYESPDHFIGADPPVRAVMQGRKGHYQYPGALRRYIIDIVRKTIRQEILHPGSFEWPFVNPHHRCHNYRYGYLAKTRGDDFFWSGITRFDTSTGKTLDYNFQEGSFCGEPVFVPVPGMQYESSGHEPGWVLTEVYSGHTRNSSLAVFDAEHIPDGPVANVLLDHHIPYSMHGFWRSIV